MSMKNYSNISENRTSSLPTCSAVPQPTAPPRSYHIKHINELRGWNAIVVMSHILYISQCFWGLSTGRRFSVYPFTRIYEKTIAWIRPVRGRVSTHWWENSGHSQTCLSELQRHSIVKMIFRSTLLLFGSDPFCSLWERHVAWPTPCRIKTSYCGGTSKMDDFQRYTQFPSTYFNKSNFNSSAFLGIFCFIHSYHTTKTVI